ncbi:MAG TPA: hypothetical protein VGC92_02030 [Phenylobacterium sp.]|jgi:hypothetical protein
MQRRMWAAAGVMAAAMGAGGAAQAQGLSNKVYAPYVEKGVT